jgi:hypothetical protein
LPVRCRVVGDGINRWALVHKSADGRESAAIAALQAMR